MLAGEQPLLKAQQLHMADVDLLHAAQGHTAPGLGGIWGDKVIYTPRMCVRACVCVCDNKLTTLVTSSLAVFESIQ